MGLLLLLPKRGGVRFVGRRGGKPPTVDDDDDDGGRTNDLASPSLHDKNDNPAIAPTTTHALPTTTVNRYFTMKNLVRPFCP